MSSSTVKRSAPSEYGKGGVYWEESRARWVFEIRVDGKRTRQRFLSEEEALDARREHVGRTLGFGEAPAVPTKDLLLIDWLRIFVDESWAAVERGALAERTAISYDAQCRLNIVPGLGHLRLTAIRAKNIESWIDGLRTATYRRGAKGQERPLGVDAQRTAAAVLKVALNEAVRKVEVTGLRSNPMAGVAMPGATGRRGTRQVTPGSYRSKAIPARYRKPLRDRIVADGCDHGRGLCAARFRLGIEVGLRQGEVLALSVDDLNLRTRELTIASHLQRKTWRHGCPEVDDRWSCGRKRGVDCPQRHSGGLVRTPGTKAGKDSTRGLVLPTSLWQCLLDHRRLVLAEGRGKDTPEQGKLLFRSPENAAISPEQDRAAFHALCDRAGIPRHSIHSLRHTAATWLCDQGEDISVVSSVLGHASIEVTLGYVHVGSRTTATALERSVDAWDHMSETDDGDEGYDDDPDDLGDEP